MLYFTESWQLKYISPPFLHNATGASPDYRGPEKTTAIPRRTARSAAPRPASCTAPQHGGGPASPIRRRISSSSISRLTASARSLENRSASFGSKSVAPRASSGTSTPVSPSTTIPGMPPTAGSNHSRLASHRFEIDDPERLVDGGAHEHVGPRVQGDGLLRAGAYRQARGYRAAPRTGPRQPPLPISLAMSSVSGAPAHSTTCVPSCRCSMAFTR